jgi:hypothetical protein
MELLEGDSPALLPAVQVVRAMDKRFQVFGTAQVRADV